MTPEQYRAVKIAFADLVDRPADARSARLERESTVVRAQVERLLEVDDAADSKLGDALEGGGGEVLAVEFGTHEVPGVHGPVVPEVIGRYHIEGVLGQGGMGTVYAARQLDPDRRVAVKVVRAGADSPEALARFRRESQVLGQLQHPGIAHIYEAGVAHVDGVSRSYFAMELIDGRRLDEHQASEQLSRDDLLELVARIADAVQHAHQKGVIHRDLKPANVLVTSAVSPGSSGGGTDPGTRTGTGDDGIGRPVVLDFGVSRVLGEAGDAMATLQTRAGAVVGTLGYMAPEQVEAGAFPADTRCDVYALGVILFELLAGRRPFDLSGRSIAAASRIIEEQDAPRLGGLVPSCRGDVESIVAKALEKSPDRRYGSAGELADDLRRAIRDEPIAARPTTALYQIRKFARRNRAIVVGATGTAVAVVAGLVSLSVTLGMVANERAAAELAETRQASIAAFQSAMLSRLDVEPMADAIRRDMARQFRTTAPDAEPDPLLRRVEALDASGIARAAFEASIADRARMVLDEGYSDDPVVVSELRAMLADMYASLDRYPEAVEQWRASFDACLGAFGFDDRRTLERLPSLLTALRRTGNADEGLPLVRRAIESLVRSSGPADPLVLWLRLRELQFRPDQTRTETLEPLRALVAEFERLPEPRGLGYVEATSVLAYGEVKAGDPDAAFDYWGRHLIPALRAGGDEVNLLHSGSIIAESASECGRHELAAELFAIVADGMARRAGPDAEKAMAWRARYARALVVMGLESEARAEFEAVEGVLRREFDLGSAEADRRGRLIADQRMRCGHFDAALALVDALLEARRALRVGARDEQVVRLLEVRDQIRRRKAHNRIVP